MEMTEHLTAAILITLLMLVCLIVFVFVIEPLTGGTTVRRFVCGFLFWLPFGSILTALTHGCAIIPA